MSQDDAAPSGDILSIDTINTNLQRLMPKLKRRALSLTRNMPDAEDMVQDTMLKVLSNRHQFEAGTNFDAWVFTILRNLFLSKVRRSGREVLGDEAFWKVIDDGRHGGHPMLDERIDLERAFAQMPDDKLVTLMRVDVWGESYHEHAQGQDVATGTVKSRVSRSRDYMQSLLGEAYQVAGKKPASLRRVRQTPPRRVSAPFNMLPKPEVKEASMDIAGIRISPHLRDKPDISVSDLARLADQHRFKFGEDFKESLSLKRFSLKDYQRELEKVGHRMSYGGIIGLFSGKGKWDEMRIKVLLEMLELSPRKLLEEMTLLAPLPEPVDPPVVIPEVVSQELPDPPAQEVRLEAHKPLPERVERDTSRLSAKPDKEPSSALDLMYVTVRRLLKERLPELPDDQQFVVLGDVIQRLTRPQP